MSKRIATPAPNLFGVYREREFVRSCDPGNTTGIAHFLKGRLIVAESAPFGDFAVRPDHYLTVVETPDRITKDPRSILKLALKAGALIERFGGIGIPAGVWKGTVPKDVMCRRILAHLSPEELAVLPKNKSALGYDHNMVDAVGLGLFALGRMARGGARR